MKIQVKRRIVCFRLEQVVRFKRLCPADVHEKRSQNYTNTPVTILKSFHETESKADIKKFEQTGIRTENTC